MVKKISKILFVSIEFVFLLDFFSMFEFLTINLRYINKEEIYYK